MSPPILPALSNFWLGTWSRPPDRPSQVALALAGVLLVVALVPGGPRWLIDSLDVMGAGDRRRSRRFLFVASFVAAFLSLGYVAFYLHGGPRAPEAATLWLEGRALLHGHLAWTAPDPTASFRARDLVFAAPDRLAGIVPPGYALLLAATFLLGAPMLVGPLLAAALVPITWLLGRELAAAAGEDEARVEAAGRVAVALSIASAALRYHTAESLPHGAAALALAVTLAYGLRARRLEAPRMFAGVGLALGFLLATQPPSAIAGTVVVLALTLNAPEPRRALGWAFVGALPGLALLLAANHAAVGHALLSPAAVYARTVSAEPGPAGVKALALATARRVRSHLTDIDNFEPIALLPLLLLRKSERPASGRGRGVGLAVAALAVQLAVLAAVGRHDAAAPAAGVEGLLAHVLPIEHALIALALVVAVPRAWSGALTAATLAFALAGFGVHASHEHAKRAAAGWGRPHYEPDVAREAGATHGLLFFDDDDGYELAHDPAALPSHALEAVRMRGDDHDRLVYDLLGHPPAHRYVFSRGVASVSSWTPNGSETWRFEAEADIPPVIAPDRAIGQVEAIDAAGTCASDSHALALTPAGAAEASVTIELPVPRGSTGPTKRAWMVTPRAFQRGSAGTAELVLVAAPGSPGPPLAQWSWSDAAKTPACSELPPKTIELSGGETRLWLVLTARGGSVALDRTTMRSR